MDNAIYYPRLDHYYDNCDKYFNSQIIYGKDKFIFNNITKLAMEKHMSYIDNKYKYNSMCLLFVLKNFTGVLDIAKEIVKFYKDLYRYTTVAFIEKPAEYISDPSIDKFLLKMHDIYNYRYRYNFINNYETTKIIPYVLKEKLPDVSDCMIILDICSEKCSINFGKIIKILNPQCILITKFATHDFDLELCCKELNITINEFPYKIYNGISTKSWYDYEFDTSTIFVRV
jgi:hypothetical protein